MDSLGPLIGPVVPPAETTRPMRVRSERVSSSSSNRLGPSSLLSFGADARTTLCMALVTRALSTLSSAVLRCWCLTGPQQPPIGGCESLSLPLLVGKRGSRRRIREYGRSLLVLFVPSKSSCGLEICLWERDDRDKKGNCLVAREYLGRFARDRRKLVHCVLFMAWMRRVFSVDNKVFQTRLGRNLFGYILIGISLKFHFLHKFELMLNKS